MRILAATMQYGRGYAQGTERYLALLSGELRRRGHEVLILAGDPERRGPSAALGAPVSSEPPILAYPTHGWMSVEGLPASEISPLVRELRVDVVHLINAAHIGVGLIDAAAQSGIPTVVSVVDFWWLCPKHTLTLPGGGACEGAVTWRQCARCIASEHEQPLWRGVARLPLLGTIGVGALTMARNRIAGLPQAEAGRWKDRRAHLERALNRASDVIFLSSTGERLLSPLLRSARGHLIRNGLEPNWFERAAARRAKPTNPSELRIGFAGAIAPHKGLHVLLEALQRLGWRETTVRIAAATARDASYAAGVERAASGLRVERLGRVSGAEMPAFYDSVDVTVIPSLCLENLPMVAVESYARGTPVISSDVPGIAEVVRDPACQFRSGSADSLARCLKSWLERRDDPATPQMPSATEMTTATVDVYQLAIQRGVCGRT